MKLQFIFASAIFMFLLSSCSTTKNQEDQVTFWVNSLKKDCVGVAPMQCLEIQKGEQLTEDGWELFYASIDGFEYEPGYIYKLSVSQENIPAQEVPADASSIRYTLKEVLKKEQDRKLRLHDIWALEAINGVDIDLAEGQERPSIEFNLTEMKLLGNNGCNNIFGILERVGENRIKLGALGSTRKMCPDMEIPNQVDENLRMVSRYKIEELQLTLMDEEEKDVLRYRKVD